MLNLLAWLLSSSSRFCPAECNAKRASEPSNIFVFQSQDAVFLFHFVRLQTKKNFQDALFGDPLFSSRDWLHQPCCAEPHYKVCAEYWRTRFPITVLKSFQCALKKMCAYTKLSHGLCACHKILASYCEFVSSVAKFLNAGIKPILDVSITCLHFPNISPPLSSAAAIKSKEMSFLWSGRHPPPQCFPTVPHGISSTSWLRRRLATPANLCVTFFRYKKCAPAAAPSSIKASIRHRSTLSWSSCTPAWWSTAGGDTFSFMWLEGNNMATCSQSCLWELTVWRVFNNRYYESRDRSCKIIVSKTRYGNGNTTLFTSHEY